MAAPVSDSPAAPNHATDASPECVVLFTRFPHPTETFLQREVRALRKHGARLRLVSLWGGSAEFEGGPVERFNRWRLLQTLWLLPYEVIRSRGTLAAEMLGALFLRWPPNAINFWENLLGLGYGLVEAGRVRREQPKHLHAVWGSAPAAAAWTLSRTSGIAYSMAAHAYDLYEHGGDWLLKEKAAAARFVRTSTAMAAEELRARGVGAKKVLLVRRGLDALPMYKALRRERSVLRIVCVARLVEKKGLERQLELYAAARAAGLELEAKIFGDGELRANLEAETARLGLTGVVELCGHRPPPEIFAALDWADVLVHTGIVARSGDRDGLPNVIPEAMSVGAVVVTSPTAGTTEAITDGVSGAVRPLAAERAWIEVWQRIARDDAWCESLRRGARKWVEENFDAARNTKQLLARIREESE